MSPDKIKNIYFGHPKKKWKSKREKMIIKLLTERQYNVINPFAEEKKMLKKYEIEHYYEKPSEELSEEIFNQDGKLVVKCDEYFGWFPTRTAMAGTHIEMDWAYILDKKITVLCNAPHPFCWQMCDVFYVGYYDFVNDTPFWVRKNKNKNSYIKKILKEYLLKMR